MFGDPEDVVGGLDAGEGEFPSQLSVQVKVQRLEEPPTYLHKCGASVINQHWALTAAHCIATRLEKLELVSVVAGTNLRSEGGTRHKLESAIVHPGYDREDSWLNDIALLKVVAERETHIPIGYVQCQNIYCGALLVYKGSTSVMVAEPFAIDGVKIAAATLPRRGQPLKDGATAIVVGWGRLQEAATTPSERLQKAELKIINQQVCRRAYKTVDTTVHDTNLCAGILKGGKGTCLGDSGGPLFVDGVLVGLTSFSVGCARKKYPAVFTRVACYLDWIAQHVEEHAIHV